jgi:DNA replication licensing factor MCM7
MEQQTVSIAKAGITTTLNARTSVLAAANPLYGRFRRISRDPYQNLMRNVNLPAALLSRFDLVFLILDKVNMDADLALARHITYVHQNAEHPPLEFEPVTPALMRSYIRAARHVEPTVPTALQGFIAEAYVAMRQREAAGASKGSSTGRGVMTARQLLSILRMAQAHARLRFSAEVEEEDVREAIRLVNASTSTLLEDDDSAAATQDRDPVSRIFSIIREIHARGNADFIASTELRDRVLRAGFTEDQLGDTLTQYEDLGLLKQNASKTQVHFVMA